MTWRLLPHHAPRFRVDYRPGDPFARTLDIVGFRQTRNYTCGYAAALMVVRAYDDNVSAKKLYADLGTARDGTRQNALLREIRKRGVGANVRYDMDFTKMRRAIDRGKLIVGYLFDVEHWLVIYGYGTDPYRVFVADPRPQEICEQLWESYGERLGGFGIVCSRRDHKTDRKTGPKTGSKTGQKTDRGPRMGPPSQLSLF